ncbi:MATE family efflux transporter [Teredinibacter sp. KSP-S5-2]|uniref:MATE family efflux transporter n=1 Tax=Teredinibacter sp. KSP-S5-2 TaxID=3034506 RepID=UPI0029347E50|nr:MATE family efflux transporter [Teredinibacter sp. KSP-S5-2]WNO09183.1 MATE family efflux transporter [Teredinibacter sp. KSP-S5-2]
MALTNLSNLPHRQAYNLAWPMIVSNLSIPLLGLVDTAMLGHLDNPQFLGAVAVGTNILAFVYWVFSFLRMGTTSIIGRALGAGNTQLISDQATNYGLFAMTIGLLLVLFQGVVLPLGVWLVVKDSAISEIALSYCQIRIIGAPAVMLTYVIVGLFIGLHNTKVPLLITVTANVTNIVLDYLFIVVLGKAAVGAAIATVVAEYLGLLIAVTLCLRHFRVLNLPKPRFEGIFAFQRWKDLIAYNRDLFIRTSALLFAFNFFTAQGAAQGADVLAANAVLMQLMLFVAFGLDGYAHAAEAMAAKALGQQNLEAFFRACWATLLSASVIAFGYTAFFIFSRNWLIALLTDIPSVTVLAKTYYLWIILIPLASVWCYLLDGIFIGAGKTGTMRNWMLIAVFGVFLPLWAVFGQDSNHGLWLSFVMFNFFRGASLAVSFLLMTKHNKWYA